MTNVETVSRIYEAFGRGDVPAVLEALSPDVQWEYGEPVDVPWLAPRRGRDGVAAFFGALGESLEFRRFEPKAILAGDDGRLVVALVDVEAVHRRTGRTIREEDEVHLFRFDEAGRVARFRHRVDTAQHLRACAAD